MIDPRATAVMEPPFSAMEAMRYGFARYGEEGGACFVFLALVEFLCLLSSAVLAFNAVIGAQTLFQLNVAPPESPFVAFIAFYLLIRSTAQLVINKWLLYLHDEREFGFNELFGFDCMQNVAAAARMAAASLVYTFYTCFGTFLLILPGLFAASTLRFYRFLIIDRDTDAIEGLRESFELSGPYKGQLINLHIMTSLLKLAGLCVFGIGYIPAAAISGLAEAYAYRRLLEEYDEETAPGQARVN
jgi:uncharacterized membrane protein